MNNKFDVDELYNIVSKLKRSKDEINSYSEILKKNPSHTMHQSEFNANEKYKKALNDFNYFIENYIKFKEKEEN